MDPITLALVVGLGSGVAGGLISQLVAGAFKTRGDTRQIQASQEVARAAEVRWQREQEFERHKLSNASTREACLNFVKQVQALHNIRLEIHHTDPNDQQLERLKQSRRGLLDTFTLVHWELRIAAPSMGPEIDAIVAGFTRLDNAELTKDREQWDTFYKSQQERIHALAPRMHDLLASGDSAGSSPAGHDEPQLDRLRGGGEKPISS